MRARETRFTGDIIGYGPRRRRWARPALMVLLVAVVLWLMSGGVFGAESASLEHAGPALSLLPPESALVWKAWQQGIVMGLSAAAIIGMTFAAVLKVKRDDEKAMERSRSGAGRDLASPSPCAEDPLALKVEWMMLKNVWEIQVACAAETRNAMLHLKRAQVTLNMDHIEAEIRLAERRLERVAVCLEKLVELQKEEGRAAL